MTWLGVVVAVQSVCIGAMLFRFFGWRGEVRKSMAQLVVERDNAFAALHWAAGWIEGTTRQLAYKNRHITYPLPFRESVAKIHALLATRGLKVEQRHVPPPLSVEGKAS